MATDATAVENGFVQGPPSPQLSWVQQKISSFGLKAPLQVCEEFRGQNDLLKRGRTDLAY